MRAGARLRGIVARVGFAVATSVVLGFSLFEARARWLVGEASTLPSELDPALERDVPLRAARARARRDVGDAVGARDDVLAALAERPRDPDLLILLAECAEAPADRLRFASAAAREAPYTVAPAEFAFETAFTAVEARAPRAAAARETVARLAALGVTEGSAEARSEALRLEAEMRTYLALAIGTHAATSPTARGMRFLDAALARARSLAAELDAP